MSVKVGIGQDSHRFEAKPTDKPLVLGGVKIPGECALEGRSDADVVLHAVTNAVSGVTGINVIGKRSDEMLTRDGIVDSRYYLEEALSHLAESYRVVHVSVAIECRRPKLSPHIPAMRAGIAELMALSVDDVGITATTGEGLSDFGRGDGIQAFAVLTASRV